MEAIAMYVLVAAAVGLIVAGAYGAMPVLVRPHGQRRLAGTAPPVALSARVPVIEPAPLARPPFEISRATPRFDPPKVKAPARADDSSEAELILRGLFEEVDLLRGEIEGLRGQLCGLIEVTNHRPAPPARRLRAKSGLPAELRQNVSQVRRNRGLARA